MEEFCIIIPAIKKNVAFPGDLVKKLNGISLIERCINKAKRITSEKNIFVVTDSQEIRLICKRNGVKHYYKHNLKLIDSDIIKNLSFFLIRIYKIYKRIIILWPYAPLIDENVITEAYKLFLADGYDILTTVKEENHTIYKKGGDRVQKFLFDAGKEKFLTEIRAFLIFNSELLRSGNENIDLKVFPYQLSNNEIEIKSYQDWWICEKLLARKRIIFRVICYDEVGMGHIYRTLALAHEITEHEIIFVCDEKSSSAVRKIAGYDYPIEVFKPDRINDGIISLKPHLVIHDILNTDKNSILKLKERGIKIVSFEDLGDGASYTDLTFNEFYDEPIIKGNNIKWGRRYFFLRDEFIDAKPRKFKQNVDSLLITYGGTDPNNLTLKTLEAVINLCRSRNIKIYVVAGPGFLHKDQVYQYLRDTDYKNIEFTYATGIMSEIMEKVQIAFSSNGRTVYELAHMNIPSIIISQHEREKTHHFPAEENGFINLGIYREGKTAKNIVKNLERLIDEPDYRRKLFTNIKKFKFSKNKKRVVRMILNLIL